MTSTAPAFAYRLLLLGMSGALASCTSVFDQWEGGRASQAPGVKNLRPLSGTTKQTIVDDFASEPQGRRPVVIALALSGGGTRAGMFAHGVMQGLNDNHVFDRVDAISSVSGGSYAAMWYFTKRMELNKQQISYHKIFKDCVPTWWVEAPLPNDPDFDYKHKLRRAMEQAGQGGDGFVKMDRCESSRHFLPGDPYRWQVHLSRWPDVFRYSETIPDGRGQGAPWVESIRLALRSVGEVLISPLVKTGSVPSAYQYGVERAWGLNPNPRTSATQSFSYTNDTGGSPQTSGWHMDAAKAQWRDLRALYNDKATEKLPLWILNTTNSPRGTGTDPSRIFEITPFGQGSELTGYLKNGTPAIDDIGTAVRASAAALDAQGAGEKFSQTWSSRNFLFPVTEWGVTVENQFQKTPRHFRLSDGGHSENLGVYSLLRRGAQNIIVVDAAEDVEGRMADLCKLRSMLNSQGLTMTFRGELADLGVVCEGNLESYASRAKAYNTSAWLNPVIPGEVVWPAASGIPPTRLWLIKLGWDQQAARAAFNAKSCETQAHPISCFLSAYYGHNAASVVRKDKLMYFPQLTTTGAGFSSSTYLFWAYRELGRSAAAMLALSPEGTLELRPGVELKPQAVNCVRPGLRPEPC